MIRFEGLYGIDTRIVKIVSFIENLFFLFVISFIFEWTPEER